MESDQIMEYVCYLSKALIVCYLSRACIVSIIFRESIRGGGTRAGARTTGNNNNTDRETIF